MIHIIIIQFLYIQIVKNNCIQHVFNEYSLNIIIYNVLLLFNTVTLIEHIGLIIVLLLLLLFLFGGVLSSHPGT